MKIHEYQAKELLKGYDIPIQDGVTIEDLAQAEAAIDQVSKDFGAEQYVIKAQVHAGGRGKGGGVKFSSSRESALENIRNILGMTLITHQTGAEGRLVKKVMIAEALDIKQEFYAAITLDRTKGQDVFMVSSEGGMEIEEVAKTSPEKIVREAIVPGFGLRPFQARNLALALGLEGAAAKQAIGMFQKLYKLYRELDCSIVEINPLIVTDQGDLIALDAKMNFDDNALYLHIFQWSENSLNLPALPRKVLACEELGGEPVGFEQTAGGLVLNINGGKERILHSVVKLTLADGPEIALIEVEGLRKDYGDLIAEVIESGDGHAERRRPRQASTHGVNASGCRQDADRIEEDVRSTAAQGVQPERTQHKHGRGDPRKCQPDRPLATVPQQTCQSYRR